MMVAKGEGRAVNDKPPTLILYLLLAIAVYLFANPPFK